MSDERARKPTNGGRFENRPYNEVNCFLQGPTSRAVRKAGLRRHDEGVVPYIVAISLIVGEGIGSLSEGAVERKRN